MRYSFPYSCSLVIFGNYAKDRFLVIIKPKLKLFSKPLNSAKKNHKKSQQKNRLKSY